MRKLALPAVMAGLMSMGFMACDTNGTDSDATTNTTDTVSDTSTGTDTFVEDTNVVTTTYTAIFLEDLWDQVCHSTSGAEGADIDAVELFDDSGNHIAYFDENAMDSERATKTCPNEANHADTKDAAGAPDGSLTTNFYSLWGGWLIGEFQSAPFIEAGNQVKVFEIDDAFCAGISQCIGSEKYDVYVAEDLDCVNQGSDFRNTCMIKLTDTDGANGSVTIDLTGF
ncbi:MAG: hypothetical protein KC635_05390 [Myxococcales bacterium]|nr:hypothetical protein [Myxococcales bacterium]MCB9733013.1 hypothetical protein [Deltaproteobacteria bacterium]